MMDHPGKKMSERYCGPGERTARGKPNREKKKWRTGETGLQNQPMSKKAGGEKDRMKRRSVVKARVGDRMCGSCDPELSGWMARVIRDFSDEDRRQEEGTGGKKGRFTCGEVRRTS